MKIFEIVNQCNAILRSLRKQIQTIPATSKKQLKSYSRVQLNKILLLSRRNQNYIRSKEV